MKAGLRFPLDKLLVEVLKTFEIYLHQLTPEAIIKMGIFIWAMRSQGLEPNTKCLCNIHELSYEMNATRKEQYNNYFGCYSFVPRPEAHYPVPTFRKRWPGAWMQEWFYVKNDLVEREDIKGIIQRPIWSRFGIRRPSSTLGNDIHACQTTFNTICTYIGTRDLVQEHIAYRMWPLTNGWEMSKEAAAGSSQGGLIYLKYTFKYRSQFDEPNDDWLDAIEATSDEFLDVYSKAEDDAMTTAFKARGKKRLNRVFDVIGFVYPNYCYPSRKQGKKRKTASSTTSSMSKSKKFKVLTHQARRIETTEVSKLIEESASISEPSRSAPVEARTEPAKEPKLKKVAEQPKALSLLRETELPKASRIPTATPRKRRMASVLDVVLESVKVTTPASTPSTEGEVLKKSGEASTGQATSEAGPSVSAEAHPLGAASLILEKESVPKKSKSPVPEIPARELEFIVRHASGKLLSKEQIAEARQYANDLKYPQGSLVYR
jgi:predicted nucleic acid-binding Zn ribbon protein